MPVSRRTHPHERAALTRTRILETALTLVDRDGAEALTMRRLGAELGVAAMSLYNHVAGREKLLDGLSEVMVAQIRVGPGDGGPRLRLRGFARGVRAVALAHPDAFKLVGMRPLQTPQALVPVDSALGALQALGLSGDEAVHAYRALVSYTRGFALAEIAGFTLEGSSATHSPSELDVQTFPHIAELAAQLAEPDREAAFTFGLEALLTGLVAGAR